MKISILVVALLASGMLSIQAQYQVVENGANYRIWQQTTNENGTNCVQSYTELATGMYYTNSSGQLVESKEEIDAPPQGGAAAVQGQHQVYFPADIYNGVLKVVAPDSRVLQSRPLGVSYDDGSNTVMIATLQHSSGWLTASNQVTYPNAFTGFKADLVCTYRRSGFECDLVFRQQPPMPDAYGLNAANCTVQLTTEFFNTADPEQTTAQSDGRFGLRDTTLKFGSMTMGHGRAFAINSTNSQLASAKSQTSVYKRWLHLQGRTFLIEEVPLVYLASGLQTLPEATNALAGMQNPASSIQKFASQRRVFPPAPEIVADTNQIQIAFTDLNKQPGVVLDYTELDSDTSDYTFYAGETYFINGGGVHIGGTTTIQGGTIIKFPEDGWAGIYCSGNVVFDTDPYNPAIFTSQNDNSVGDMVDGSSGSPAEGGNTYLFANFVEVDHCQFSYAGTAVATWADTCIYNDLQLSQCYYGIVGGNNTTVHNVLASGCQWVFDAGPTCDNCTFNSCAVVTDGDSEFTNCIFSSNGNIGFSYYDPSLSIVGSHNEFDNPDQAFGDNVVTGSIVDAGSVTADMVGLYWWTTQGPNTIEGTTIVDLGCHTPAVDGSGNPIDTEVPGVPDYISDPNGHGLPDAWEMSTFGNLNQTASQLDGLGNTLLYDYTNGVDLTPAIQFSIVVTNNYVNNMAAPVQLSIGSGVPGYIAVSVDDPNYAADANWQDCTGTNITVNLGTQEGWHGVWIGLRRYMDSPSAAVWWYKRLKLDLTPPLLVVTNPVMVAGGATTSVPLIQLQGYCPEALAGISYDLSNAVAVVTNQDGGITDQFYDTNTFEFTTNYFECVDVPLTNGLNIITLHATDMAGNTTTTNFGVTVDYSSRTNPPVVNLYWPQDQTLICNGNYTWRGWVDDPTATVTAQMVDTSGNTNMFYGIVERNGNFWVENLPMTGTNYLTLTVADSAGNVAVTNITVFPGAVALTIAMPDASLLWNQGITVNGTISDTNDYTVWVNGVKAAFTDASDWTATNVYLPEGGTALIQARAIPNSSNGGNGTGGSGGGPVSYDNLGNPDPAQDNDTESQTDKQPRLYIASYTDTESGSTTETSASGSDWTSDVETGNISGDWADGAGGSSKWDWSELLSSNYGTWTNTAWVYATFDSSGNEDITNASDDDLDNPFVVNMEHCAIGTPVVDGSDTITYPTDPPTTDTLRQVESRNADAVMKLQTGGKGNSSRQNLFCLSASAAQTLCVKAPYYHYTGTPPLPTPPPILPQSITIMKRPLDTNGNLYVVLPDNTTQVVTPIVKGVDYYTFTENQQKYLCYFTAFAEEPNPGYGRWAAYSLGSSFGHCWWEFTSFIPPEAFSALGVKNYSYLLEFCNTPVGYFPVDNNAFALGIPMPGYVKVPGGADETVHRTFTIGFNQLTNGLTFSANLASNPPYYYLYSQNCTTMTIQAGQQAGVSLPFDIYPQNFGIDLSNMPAGIQ